MVYPDKLLRGISKANFVDPRQIPTPEMFPFKEINKEARGDGYSELSINWYDDAGALDQLFDQKKDDGSFQFSIGAIVLVKKQIDLIKKKYAPILDYERHPLDGNIYHGNILLKTDVERNDRRTIVANLAVCCCEEIIQRG